MVVKTVGKFALLILGTIAVCILFIISLPINIIILFSKALYKLSYKIGWWLNDVSSFVLGMMEKM